MKVKNILEKLRLEKLDYTFCLSDNDLKKLQQISTKGNDWNNFAFSYISSKLKKDFYKKLFICSEPEKKLSYFCEKHCYSSYDKLNSYNFERIKIKEFTRKVYDWIIISSDFEIKKEIILENLIKKELITHKYFIFYLIYFFYNNLKYKETIFFIDYLLKEKIFTKDKDKLYNDLILYKLISLKKYKDYNYLNNKNIFEEICKTVKNLEDFSYIKVITLLECALEEGNEKKFKAIIEEKFSQIKNFALLELLNIYELSIYMRNDNIIEKLRNIIVNKDINLLNENYSEYIIYNFLEFLRLKNKEEIEKYKKLIENKVNTFSFEHFRKYYLKK